MTITVHRHEGIVPRPNGSGLAVFVKGERPSDLLCPYCHDGLHPVDIEECPDCGTPHHAECLEEEGCAVCGDPKPDTDALASEWRERILDHLSVDSHIIDLVLDHLDFDPDEMDADDWQRVEDFCERYVGTYDSPKEFAQRHLADAIRYDESLEDYIDWDSYGRDAIDSDYIDVGPQEYVLFMA